MKKTSIFFLIQSRVLIHYKDKRGTGKKKIIFLN